MPTKVEHPRKFHFRDKKNKKNPSNKKNKQEQKKQKELFPPMPNLNLLFPHLLLSLPFLFAGNVTGGALPCLKVGEVGVEEGRN